VIVAVVVIAAIGVSSAPLPVQVSLSRRTNEELTARAPDSATESAQLGVPQNSAPQAHKDAPNLEGSGADANQSNSPRSRKSSSSKPPPTDQSVVLLPSGPPAMGPPPPPPAQPRRSRLNLHWSGKTIGLIFSPFSNFPTFISFSLSIRIRSPLRVLYLVPPRILHLYRRCRHLLHFGRPRVKIRHQLVPWSPVLPSVLTGRHLICPCCSLRVFHLYRLRIRRSHPHFRIHRSHPHFIRILSQVQVQVQVRALNLESIHHPLHGSSPRVFSPHAPSLKGGA